MILDVVDTGPMYMSMLLYPIFIIFLFITIGRFDAYKKNKNNKEKTQFIIFLIITIILAVSMIYIFFSTPEKKPNGNQWQNISKYHEK